MCYFLQLRGVTTYVNKEKCVKRAGEINKKEGVELGMVGEDSTDM